MICFGIMVTTQFALVVLLALGGFPAGLRPADGVALRVSRGRLMPALWLSPQGAWRSPKGPWARLSSFGIDRLLENLFEKTFERRLIEVSARFLETPYLGSPLGEGGLPPDPDPLLRFDAVDCTTFVEQSMALAYARSLQDALYWLRRIRYMEGRIAYPRRKHFMMAQWIPVNQAEGFLRDITADLAGDDLQWVEKCINAKIWARRKADKPWPELLDAQIPDGCFRLPILPLGRVLVHARKLPSGTLVNIVREDFHSMPTRVTHQGLIVQREGRTFLRHAGRSGWGRVVDEALDRFVRRNLVYRKWRVKGFNFQRILPTSRTLPP